MSKVKCQLLFKDFQNKNLLKKVSRKFILHQGKKTFDVRVLVLIAKQIFNYFASV